MPSVQGGAAYPVALYDSQGNPLIFSGGALPAAIAGPLGAQLLAASVAMNETSTTLYAGTLITGAGAAPLAASQVVREVIVQNDPDSTTDILVGNAGAQTIQLKPGQSLVIPVSDLATVYAKSVSGAPVLNYLGRS